MSNVRRQMLLNALKLFDLGLMMIAFLTAALPVLHQSRGVSFAEFFSMRVKVENFIIFSLLILCWHFCFSLFGLYHSRRFSSRINESADVVKATSVGTLAILAGAVVFHVRLVTPLFLATFWLVATAANIASRFLMRMTLASIRRHGRNLRHVLIVGSNQRALEFCRELETRRDLGFSIVGFVDQEWSGLEEFKRTGYAFLSDLDGLAHCLRHTVVDEVVVALPMNSQYREASRVAALCEEHGITFHLLSDLFNLRKAKRATEDWQSGPHITHTTGIAEGWPVMVKHTLDALISIFALILLSPVLLITTILIKLTSPGPVLFVQKRVGRHKRRFYIYKFRTMIVDAENKMRELEHLNEVTGPVFKIKNDPRVTRLGRFLRKTSIDELPQLFNVLNGDMSLVGPRPLPVRDYDGFSEDWQRRRFSVRPGITCLWQISGRNSIPFRRWMELDLEYIDGWSLWLDLRILLRTIPAVLRGSGAA
jgi:exopolysaccharide biosynthesis polyprenyl glycosylphosphotransferase